MSADNETALAEDHDSTQPIDDQGDMTQVVQSSDLPAGSAPVQPAVSKNPEPAPLVAVDDTEDDFRTGPKALFDVMRGKLLGPVGSAWKNHGARGGLLQFHHKVPNGPEEEDIMLANQSPRKFGFALEFVLRARNSKGDLIYTRAEAEMIHNRFQPNEVFEIVMAMRAQCEGLNDKVTDGEIKNS